MKDKDRWFEQAMDTLKDKGVNVMAAAHWPDQWLLAVGLSTEQLKGWRRWFWPFERKDLEIGAPRNECVHIRRTRDERGYSVRSAGPRGYARWLQGHAADEV